MKTTAQSRFPRVVAMTVSADGIVTGCGDYDHGMVPVVVCLTDDPRADIERLRSAVNRSGPCGTRRKVA